MNRLNTRKFTMITLFLLLLVGMFIIFKFSAKSESLLETITTDEEIEVTIDMKEQSKAVVELQRLIKLKGQIRKAKEGKHQAVSPLQLAQQPPLIEISSKKSKAELILHSSTPTSQSNKIINKQEIRSYYLIEVAKTIASRVKSTSSNSSYRLHRYATAYPSSNLMSLNTKQS